MKSCMTDALALLALACVTACTSTHSPPTGGSSGSDGGPSRDDAGLTDAGSHDLDASDRDASYGDASIWDASVLDASNADASNADASNADASYGDAAVPEAGDEARVDYDKLIALCEASPAQRAPYENEAELIELLIAKWIDCRNSTGFHPDQDGVWFREDKTWAALFVAPNGAVSYGAGVDGTGEWDIYYEPDPGPQRPALHVGGGHIVRPAFTRDPFQLRNVSEDEDGQYLDRYVRLRDVL
jgi:hypothetical protein